MEYLPKETRQNGVDFTLIGDYYIPDIQLPEESRPIGMWGRMHENYLTLYRPAQYTHNTDLKKRLTAFAEQYPDHCTMTDEDGETGRNGFEVEKGRMSFRLTAPYSQEWRQAASEYARQSIAQHRKIAGM